MDDFPDLADLMPSGGSDYWQEPDFLFANLVSLLANKMDAQLGVTLMVKGAIMTGTLVGEREYLKAVNEMFKSLAKSAIMSPSKDDLKAIDEAFAFDELTEDEYPEGEEEAAESDFDPASIRFLHLRDPVIIYPGSALSFMESPLPIMRIRLTQVDGWMIGRMTLVSDDDLPDSLPSRDIKH
jgi:hypothetical protein